MDQFWSLGININGKQKTIEFGNTKYPVDEINCIISEEQGCDSDQPRIQMFRISESDASEIEFYPNNYPNSIL